MKDKDLVPLMITRLMSQILVVVAIILAITHQVDTLEGLDAINPLYANTHNWVIDPDYIMGVVVVVIAMCAIEIFYQLFVIMLLDVQEEWYII